MEPIRIAELFAGAGLMGGGFKFACFESFTLLDTGRLTVFVDASLLSENTTKLHFGELEKNR